MQLKPLPDSVEPGEIPEFKDFGQGGNNMKYFIIQILSTCVLWIGKILYAPIDFLNLIQAKGFPEISLKNPLSIVF